MSDPLSITAGVAGILSLTIEVSRLLREQINTYQGALKDAQEILDQVDRIAQVLQGLERLIMNDATKIHFEKTSALVTICDAFHEHMFKLRNDLKKVAQVEGRFKKSVQKCKWIFTVEDRKEVLKTLQEYLHLFHLNLDIEGLGMLAKSAADIKALQIEKADLTSRRLDCLPTIATDTRTARELIESLEANTDDSLQRHALSTWLTHLDYSDRHRQISQSRLNDTGQWILYDPTFLDWAHGSNQVLICTGVPGVGKTVTTSAVINSLLKEYKEDATVAVVYVYCSEQFKDKESTVELLGSFILQLLAHLDTIPKDLQESFEDHSRGRAPLNQEDASALLELVASKFAQVYIAFDALDECFSRDDFIDVLEPLIPLHKLWITSRPFAMKDYSMFDGALHLSLSAADTDIIYYVKTRAAKSPKLKRYLEKDATLLPKMQANVLRKANGVFLIVRYHLDALVQAAAMSIQHVRDVLESLPSNMTEVYEAAWGRILAQNPLDAQIATCVLSWVSCAKRPLRKLQILHAASIYAGSSDQKFRSYLTHDCILQPDYIFSVCVGLISLDESNDSFGFFHATAASYFHRLFTSQLDGHNNILHCSVAYLSMDYFSKSNFQVDSSIDIIDNHPLLDYVPLQFQYHYDHVMASNRQLAYDLLLSLLDTMDRFRSDCQVMYDEYENLTGGDSVPRRDEALRNMTKFGIHPLPKMICRHHVPVGGVYKWWSRRHHRFVAYKNETVGGRFMVDISAYFAQMPVDGKARNIERASVLDIQMDHIIVFPPTIKGYTLYNKQWLDLQVDAITEVVWNKELFKSLVMETDTKELIQTLVSLRLESQKPDLISGQSNRLMFLLHDGSGTGKTFTVESVAELAEKPLYLITWDYIGTAEGAESYFESVLSLGKAWGCVVLLDEADVFFEQRTPEHPARSAFTRLGDVPPWNLPWNVPAGIDRY